MCPSFFDNDYHYDYIIAQDSKFVKRIFIIFSIYFCPHIKDIRTRSVESPRVARQKKHRP